MTDALAKLLIIPHNHSMLNDWLRLTGQNMNGSINNQSIGHNWESSQKILQNLSQS